MCGADFIVMGVPTSGFRRVLEDAAPYMRPWIPVVSLSKGLERGSHLRMTEVIRQVVPGHPVAALTGPNIAAEILAGKAAAAVIATEDLEVASAIQAVFTRGVFRVYINDDVIGCELGGALKNVIAIAAGIGEGLGVGDNTRAAVMSRGLAELIRLGVCMGARARRPSPAWPGWATSSPPASAPTAATDGWASSWARAASSTTSWTRCTWWPRA